MEKGNSGDGVSGEEEGGYDAVVVGSGYGGSVAACRMSEAGFKVCLMEKGKKWEAHDFPTNSWQLLVSALRMENRNLGINFGPQDALFQVHVEDDSLVAMACGLGGGSLVNAGVMLRTPIRTRRNPKWPKEWETNWESCEASASSMLRIQSIPTQFPIGKIMQELTGEENEEKSIDNSINLSINFDVEEQPIISKRSKENIASCLACGNCLSGCPYNAKNSTDKNYLATAIQAGCTIKTGCQVQYVVKNPNDIHEDEESGSKKRRRRWLVFLNETDFVTADFVILSAGVFGTTKILFQSQMRGLALSERLGSGFSCNGNNVAYLAGSTAPLSGYGLDKSKLSTTPFEQRPGPSISSLYTSSLGFTIQTAVLPMAYPYLLFKGIATYGWPSSHWFLHGIIDKLKHSLGLKNNQAIVLAAVGHDDNNGKIIFEKDSSRISFRPPHDPQLPQKIDVFQKLTRKLGGNLFMSRFRSTSVHLLGGCNASLDPSEGVCNSKGQVFDKDSSNSVHDGLYVCDASLIPCSVGINPCLTIATASEHVSKHLVQDMLKYKHKESRSFIERANLGESAGSVNTLNDEGCSEPEIIFNEVMRGHVNGMPCTAYLKMKMNPNSFLHDGGKRTTLPGKSHPLLRGKVGGYVEIKALETERLYVVNGEVDLCKVDIRTPYTQYMHYRLTLAASSGSRYTFNGNKVMNPYLLGLYILKESTTMYVTLKKETKIGVREEMLNLKGKLQISMIELLKSLLSMKGRGRVKFIWLLTQSLVRTFILQIPRGHQQVLAPFEFLEGPYPFSTSHEMKTEDGFIISCRQWKCTQSQQRPVGEKQQYPVLLINGYSTESFCLPTETKDMVRTLLEAGHETWILQPRLHPLNSSTDFTIEDIGQFDIPCAINKIVEVYGTSTKVHVVAHCVGGLGIHISLMGGHVSATKIASLSCTNSSMFFKLTPSARFKMWLPLIPMSMSILGSRNILPLIKTIKFTSRQQLLKSIARFIPRQERCTYDECEVFSGIFGNTFWHSNIKPSLHHWIIKKSVPRLPMAGFPHLRKICKAGYIVDSKGKNSYLIHPERMALPTLYISGGRTLLVTPKTSFFANNYMKLHQPSYRHERVVVDGFGHSDLLIGEESYKRVFPHILLHIEVTEKGGSSGESGKGIKYSKKALSWGDDPYDEEKEGLESLVSPAVTFWFLFFLIVMLHYMYFV